LVFKRGSAGSDAKRQAGAWGLAPKLLYIYYFLLVSAVTIVGEIGYSKKIPLTAIADAVNTPSRLESLTKDYKCQFVISKEVAKHAGLKAQPYADHEIQTTNYFSLAIYTHPTQFASRWLQRCFVRVESAIRVLFNRNNLCEHAG